MSNGYRDGAFALGLVVGGGLALNLFLWLDYQANRECENSADNCQASENSQIGTFWDGFVGTFVSPSDTLAQWVMAFFTIAATVVLVFTLRSANKTNRAAIIAANAANEANNMMRSERRPWMAIENVRVAFDASSRLAGKSKADILVYSVKFDIKNVGALPARDCEISIWIDTGVSAAVRREFLSGASKYEGSADFFERTIKEVNGLAHLNIAPQGTYTFEKTNFYLVDKENGPFDSTLHVACRYGGAESGAAHETTQSYLLIRKQPVPLVPIDKLTKEECTFVSVPSGNGKMT